MTPLEEVAKDLLEELYYVTDTRIPEPRVHEDDIRGRWPVIVHTYGDGFSVNLHEGVVVVFDRTYEVARFPMNEVYRNKDVARFIASRLGIEVQ